MLDTIKTLLGFDVNDTDPEIDAKLRAIITIVKSRLKLLLGGLEVPASLEHIIVEVSIIRFNRIGSEGVTSHTVEGESATYSTDDFAAYSEEIAAYLDSQKVSAKGRLVFL